MGISLSIDGSDYNIWNVYGPCQSTERIAVFDRLCKVMLDRNYPGYTIAGGDFNVTLEPKIDKFGGNHKQCPSAKVLSEIMESLDTSDVWRTKNHNKRQYTWRQKTPLIMCRLDLLVHR